MGSEAPKRVPPARPSPPAALAANPAEEFEVTYLEAYKCIDQGINLVTQGSNVQAGVFFQKGLTLIDKALSIKVESLDCSAEKAQQYAEMQMKMRCTKKEVLNHFSDSQSTTGAGGGHVQGALEDAPPSYDDYLKSLDSASSSCGPPEAETAAASGQVSYPQLPQLSTQAGEGVTPLTTPVMSPQHGEMIFQVENGVQIFFIYKDGSVTSPSYPSFLAVFTFPEPIGGASNGARGFLQVGEWSYPLVPAHSPVLHSFYGAYMFPDVSNSVPESSVGVILPDTLDKEQKELFEQILMQLTSYQEQVVPPGVDQAQQTQLIHQSTSERIASGLVTGAEAVSKGVVWGAGELGKLISFGSESLKNYVQPATQKTEIDPKWQKRAQAARNVSGCAVKVSGFLLSQVGKATMALGRTLAPHVQRHGTKAITHLTGQREEEATNNVEGVMEVAAGAVRGASTLYMSLETAAATLASNITDNTVKVISHKYGEEAGSLADNTLYAVGQTAWAGHNIASLGVKGVAKRAAKDTGKALVQQYEEKKGQAQVEEAEEAMEEEEGTEAGPAPVRPIREKKKPSL